MEKRFVCMGMAVILAASALAFAGCGEGELKKQIDELQTQVELLQDQINALDDISTREIEVTVGFEDFGFDGVKEDTIEKVITTYDDWKSTFPLLEMREQTADSNNPDWEDPSLKITQLKQKYDQSFFQRKSLIVFKFLKSSIGGWELEATVRKEKRECTVELNLGQDGYMQAFSQWVVILEVKQADVARLDALKLSANFNVWTTVDGKLVKYSN